MTRRCSPHFVAFALLGSACYHSHEAVVQTAALPPPPDPVVRHSRRLWLELDPAVDSAQCVTPNATRPLCFAELEDALAGSLERALWTSFPGVHVLGSRDAPDRGDYVLKIDLKLDAVPPSAGGPGWAAVAKGRWQLVRDGKLLAGESVESRSRADFGYGRPLGVAAGEVVDAVAFHVGVLLGSLPESEPDRPVPLPAVSAETLDGVSASRVVAGR